MKSYSELIKYLEISGALYTPRIIKAFNEIDRRNFILPEYEPDAYYDGPLPIGYGQTISQPTVVAMMLEWLQPEPGDKVLDIGSGSGWTTTLLANCVGPTGKVIGLERVQELVDFGKANLAYYNYQHADILLVGKPLGIPGEYFDKILVSAAANELPAELIKQLKIGGVMAVPVTHSIYVVEKLSETKYEENINYGFSFVPLI